MTLDVAAAYREHRYGVLAYVSRHMTGVAAPDAEDVASAVWERVLRAADRYRDDGKLLSWLYTIARNLVTDYHAHRRIVRLEQIGSEALDMPAVAAERAYATVEYRAALVPALNAILPSQRHAVTLLYLADATIAQTAAELDTTVSSVKKLRERGLVNLRKRMTAEDAA